MKAAAPTLAVAPALEKSARLGQIHDRRPGRIVQDAPDDFGVVDYIRRFLRRLARADGLGALMFHTMLGTALLAAGASALNQLLEREYDAKMRRTQDRPLPSGRAHAGGGLIIGGVCAGAGLIYLALTVNQLTGLAGGLDPGQLFVGLYAAQARHHPEHRRRRHSRRAAALDGLDGGARGSDQRRLVALCHPVLLATAPFPGHRLDVSGGLRPGRIRHAAGGGPERRAHGQQALSHTLGLLPVSLCPFLFGLAGPVYLAGALALGAGFLWCAWRIFAADQPGRSAALVLRLHSLSAAIIVFNGHQ